MLLMSRNPFAIVMGLLALVVVTLLWWSRPDGEGGLDETSPPPGRQEMRRGGDAGDGNVASDPVGATAIRERLAQARRVGSNTGTAWPVEPQEEVDAEGLTAEARPAPPPTQSPADTDTQAVAGDAGGGLPPDVAYDSGTEQRFSTSTQTELPDVGKLSGEAGTMAFWLRPEWAGDDQNDTVFLQLGDSGVHINKNVTYLRFEVTGSEGNEQGLGAYIGDWKPGEWHQVVGTWVGGQFVLFVDGKPVSQKMLTDLPDFQQDTRVYVGSNLPPGNTAIGDLSHVKVLNRPLTPAEVADLFQAADRPR